MTQICLCKDVKVLFSISYQQGQKRHINEIQKNFHLKKKSLSRDQVIKGKLEETTYGQRTICRTSSKLKINHLNYYEDFKINRLTTTVRAYNTYTMIHSWD